MTFSCFKKLQWIFSSSLIKYNPHCYAEPSLIWLQYPLCSINSLHFSLSILLKSHNAHPNILCLNLLFIRNIMMVFQQLFHPLDRNHGFGWKMSPCPHPMVALVILLNHDNPSLLAIVIDSYKSGLKQLVYGISGAKITNLKGTHSSENFLLSSGYYCVRV